MPTSQNGYSAPVTPVRYDLPGGVVSLRAGATGALLAWVGRQFHARVEPLVWPGCWGYNYREIRGATQLSNHSSGTALDLNAPRHPLGTDPTANFSATQIREIHAILAQTEGCVRWGGDYVGRKDGMHFEINDGVSEGRCSAVLSKLSSKPDPTMEEIMTMALPQSLPRSPDFQQLTFPVEVGALADGGNSSVIKTMWLTLVSAWDDQGTTEYHVWISDDRGNRVGATPGSHSVDGVIKNNGFALIGLPKGARIVTLQYRNTGKAQAGYAFPQISQ